MTPTLLSKQVAIFTYGDAPHVITSGLSTQIRVSKDESNRNGYWDRAIFSGRSLLVD
jgi:hypothetical protein